MVLSEAEKERIAYHEGGHAVLAYVLEHADPVHKVTILPTGMALGVTHQLPMEERHIHPRQYIEDSLCVRMGGRCAELLVYGDLSTGAGNDLVGNTELARKMVREWGMSEEIGPMAWGSQGQVFLGEDLMHTRDYSEHTSQVIDDEVELILRSEEQRALEALASTGAGSTPSPAPCSTRRPSTAPRSPAWSTRPTGRPVHTEGAKSVPHFHDAAINAPASNGGTAQRSNGAGNGHGRTTSPCPTARQARRPVAVPAAPLHRRPSTRRRVVAAPGVAPARRPRGRRPGGTRNPLPQPARRGGHPERTKPGLAAS